MRAIQFHMVEQATAIIGRGADVTAKTTYGATALTLAVTGDHNESVELLLNYDSDPRQMIDVSVFIQAIMCVLAIVLENTHLIFYLPLALRLFRHFIIIFFS